jgi:hypothetical protein
MRSRVYIAFLFGGMLACGGAESKGEDSEAAEGAASAGGPDPCTLVSEAEMAEILGPLGERPFRIDNNRRADPAGSDCMYRARDGHNISVSVDWEDGEMLMRMMGATAGAAEKTLGTQDIGADTLEGAWDEVGLSFGQFLARKGKTAVQVDPLGARVGLDAVARIAAIALRRTGSPLSYDGAKAARSRKPEPASRNPCSLVTKQEAEGLMGRLKGDPVASEDNSECEFALDAEMMGYPVTNALAVEWRDGFHSLGQELLSTGMASKMMSQEMGGDIPQLGTSSSGAQEPWAEMHVLLGGVVTVVKNDVLLRIPGTGVNGFDEEKAKALLRIAVGRL